MWDTIDAATEQGNEHTLRMYCSKMIEGGANFVGFKESEHSAFEITKHLLGKPYKNDMLCLQLQKETREKPSVLMTSAGFYILQHFSYPSQDESYDTIFKRLSSWWKEGKMFR